jgi:hypothetical protein
VRVKLAKKSSGAAAAAAESAQSEWRGRYSRKSGNKSRSESAAALSVNNKNASEKCRLANAESDLIRRDKEPRCLPAPFSGPWPVVFT